MSSYYFMTKRLGEIIESSSGTLSYEQLDGNGNRKQATLYLADIYKRHSDVSMTALDYKNIYNLFYVICLPDFGKSLQPQRVGLAKEYVKQVQNGQVKLNELIDDLLFTSHLI